MLATTASQLSPSDTWRRMEEKTKERSTLGSWRERKVSKESGETRESGVKTVMSKLSGEMKDLSGSWRVRKREDVTRVYGEAMPAEWRLQQLYKQLKVNNNKFTTWVVESIYPCSESLPSYVTLSHEQAKGEQAKSRSDVERKANNFQRLFQIRHRRQQHDRACTQNRQSAIDRTGSPPAPHC